MLGICGLLLKKPVQVDWCVMIQGLLGVAGFGEAATPA